MTFDSPVQVLPSVFSLNPVLQLQVYDPSVLVQVCWQALVLLELHSLLSV